MARAEHAARAQDFDCAILDINLAGEPIHPVAQVLAEPATPFVFFTGYGEAGADERFAERPVLKKPFRPEELREALRRLVAEGRTARHAHSAVPPSLPRSQEGGKSPPEPENALAIKGERGRRSIGTQPEIQPAKANVFAIFLLKLRKFC